MTELHITGWGAVSPAGWSAGAMREALLAGVELSVIKERRCEGAPERLLRKVPAQAQTPDYMKHARLRRTSAAARFAVHAAVEALGAKNLALTQSGELRTGVVFCTMNGCVQFSRRFFAEVLANPALASPILFPETVYNAPASHLSALLGSPEMNYTLVGDSAQFLRGIELAAQWLDGNAHDACLVVAAEELDWVSDEALALFGKRGVIAEGAAAVLLQREPLEGSVAVSHLTEAWTYGGRTSRVKAAREVQAVLQNHAREKAVLFDGLGVGARVDAAERRASSWMGRRISVRKTLGEGFAVTSGWQTVAACEWLNEEIAPQALISAVGLTQQAAGLVLGAGRSLGGAAKKLAVPLELRAELHEALVNTRNETAVRP